MCPSTWTVSQRPGVGDLHQRPLCFRVGRPWPDRVPSPGPRHCGRGGGGDGQVHPLPVPREPPAERLPVGAARDDRRTLLRSQCWNFFWGGVPEEVTRYLTFAARSFFRASEICYFKRHSLRMKSGLGSSGDDSGDIRNQIFSPFDFNLKML